MLYRALSLFLLLCPFYTAPAEMVTFLAKGIKNIVFPVVASAVTGKQISSSAHFRRMHDFSDIDRGVPTGVQSTQRDNFNSSNNNSYNNSGGGLTPQSFNNPALYSEAGVPLYQNGIPTEEFFREQSRIAKRQEQQSKEAKKAREASAQKAKENKGGGSGGGDKDPKKEDQEILDKIKHRSDLERKAVQDPDIRTKYQELGFPDPENPNEVMRHMHVFRPDEGHIAQRTPAALTVMNRAFREGTHLGQDIHGNHHIEWIHPENGDQFWLKVRPDGKLMDGGASEAGKHWIRDPKTNFLQKPKGIGKKGSGGGNWKYRVVTVIAGSALDAAANATKNRLGLNDDQLTALLQDKIERMMPDEFQKKMTAERKASFDKSLSELRAYEEAKIQHYNEKKFPKPNIPVIMEKKIEHDLAPAPVQRSESSSSSSGESSYSSSFKSGSGIGGMRLGPTPMLLGTGSFSGFPSSKFTADDDDDDDDDLLWDDGDDDDDDDWGKCHGLGCR